MLAILIVIVRADVGEYSQIHAKYTPTARSFKLCLPETKSFTRDVITMGKSDKRQTNASK